MRFDAIIVGAGLVGLSLACALKGTGLKLALVERDAPDHAGPPPGLEGPWDARVYAISPGSQEFLERIGAWPADSPRLAPVYAMQVYGDLGASHIGFSAYEAHIARLATIVEGRCLLAGLWDAIDTGEAVVQFLPARCESIAWREDAAILTLEDGRALHGRLLLAADGAESWVRRAAGMDATVSPYAQKAVVANFACEGQHSDTAFQWFRRDGVLALLPLPGQRVSMVWSAPGAVADALLATDSAELCRQVAEASSGAVGGLNLLDRPQSFPLRLVRVSSLVRPRLALVGDAAHNLHPLAGQGVNLGFQDARQLVDVLTQRGACHDIGELRLLRRYERARREAVLAMTLATDGLHRLFSRPSKPIAWLRNSGLSLVDRVRPLKRLLVQHAIA